MERHIVKTSFLGKQVSVHEQIVEPLKRVDTQIRTAATTNPLVEEFIRNLNSAEGYSWRQIRDTSGISFHSMGLAIDLLPRRWQNKIIYWNWEKNKGNEDWMLIPLSERWMPPDIVIDIFEKAIIAVLSLCMNQIDACIRLVHRFHFSPRFVREKLSRKLCETGQIQKRSIPYLFIN